MDSAIKLLFQVAVFILICIGANAWFTWNLPQIALYGAISLIALIYKIQNNIVFKYNSSIILSALLLLFSWMWINWSWAKMAFVLYFLKFFPLIVLFFDKNIFKTIAVVSKMLAILLIPSIILYVIVRVDGIPHFSIVENNATDVYVFKNYIFYIQNIYTGERFGGPFLEPGYLGTLCAFMIYLLRYNFSTWYSKTILISLVLSLSLAGIIICIIGYIILNIQYTKTLKRVILVSFVLITGCIFFQNYNGGDNVINEKILSRLQFDKEKGISGNNRFSYTTDLYYDIMIKSGLIWKGLGTERINSINGGSTGKGDFGSQIRGAGYKIFILYYGIIPVLMLIAFYLLMGPFYKNISKRYSIGFFIIVLLTAIQASYPFSYSWLIPYLVGTRMSSFIHSNHHENTFYRTYYRLAR